MFDELIEKAKRDVYSLTTAEMAALYEIETGCWLEPSEENEDLLFCWVCNHVFV